MSSLQDKMYKYEVAPPAGVWDRIAADLDDSFLSDQFPSTLQNIEVEPPAGSWDKISSALGEEQPIVVPVQKKAFAFLRYAAAAVLVGILAFAVIKYTSTTNKEVLAVSSKKNQGDSGRTNKERISSPALNETNDAIVNEETPKEETKSLLAKVEHHSGSNYKKTGLAYSSNESSEDADEEGVSALYAYEDHIPAISDRYIMLMTPDGNLIRMSKKWSSLVCCVSGSEEDPDCKDQLKKWQEKMASADLAPSPGNFMDILTLVNSLEDGSDL